MEAPRPCLLHELAALITAANRVFRQSGADMGRDYPLLFSEDNVSNLSVITDDTGAIVAHAGLCLRRASLRGVTVDVGLLGAVFTRDDRRGRGLGAAVVSASLDRARAAGVALVLVSGDGPLYRRLGFTPAPPATAWACPAPAAREGIDLRPAREDDIPLLARLYDAEPVHFVRDAADWRAILRASVSFAWPARLWIVTDGGAPAGYLAVAQRSRRCVLEHAGDRDALLAAAPQVSEDVVVPGHENGNDDETERQLRARAWENRPFVLAATIQWLRVPAPPLPPPWYGLNYV